MEGKIRTKRAYPKFVFPTEFDRLLANGWYRMGQSVFTNHFMWFRGELHANIWLRLPLKDYHFQRKRKRLITRNGQRFFHTWRKARLDESKERLFQKYRKYFWGRMANNLRESLQDGGNINIFNTYEVCVYDGNKLIAYSFFDVGRNSIASLMGIYDPDYKVFSPGYYTMLLEIQFGLNHGLSYYYPGYIVPDYEGFNYKMRIGKVEYYNVKKSNWELFNKKTPPPSPLDLMQKRLQKMQATLQNTGIVTQFCKYVLFDADVFGLWKIPYLDYPLFLWCFPKASNLNYILIVYDVLKEKYLLLQCGQFDETPFLMKSCPNKKTYHGTNFRELLVVQSVIAESITEEGILQQLTADSERQTVNNKTSPFFQ